MLSKQNLINLFVALCVVFGLASLAFGSAMPQAAAEAPELPLAEILFNQGITKLEVGKTYPVAGNVSVTLEYARNGKGTQIDVKIVKRTGHLKSDPTQTFVGYFFEHLARTAGMAPAVISETEDVRMGWRFNTQVDNSRDGTLDDDPKNNNNEQGARYKVNGTWYEMDHSASNVDNEVTFKQVDQKTDLIEFESDDSWHSIIFVRLPLPVTTPTPTIPITLTATPPTATPIIPPGTTVYTLYLSLVAFQPYIPPPTPTNTPTPVNDCRVLDAPGQTIKEVNGLRIIKPARGAQVLLQAQSLTGDNALLTLWEKGAQISGTNEFSFRANPGTRNFEARFNGQPALQPCTIRVEVSSGGGNPTATPEIPPTPVQPTATPELPPTPPPPTQPPAVANN